MPLPRKLSDHQVRAIRRSGLSSTQAAAKYGVSPKTIRNIRDKSTYEDVPVRPPVPPDAHHRFDKKYETGDVVQLLEEVPEGYAGTILTMAPPLYAGHCEHVHRERRIIEECLRIAGEPGVVIYIHRPQLGDDGVIDLGAGILEGWPLRQTLIWTWPFRSEPSADPAGRGLRLRQNYASIHILSGQLWTAPAGDAARRWGRGSGSVWSIPLPDQANTPPGFPLELARHCIALGPGRVLDPRAGTGTTALAAKEANRDWTLLDETDAHRYDFELRMAGGGNPDPARPFGSFRATSRGTSVTGLTSA